MQPRGAPLPSRKRFRGRGELPSSEQIPSARGNSQVWKQTRDELSHQAEELPPAFRRSRRAQG